MSWIRYLIEKFSIKDFGFTKKRPSDLVLMKELVQEATKWVGVHKNSSVDVFRKATDGVAAGEPWCAAFVQYCVSAVALEHKCRISLYPSELCSTIWEETPHKYRMEMPVPGSVVIWNYPGTIHGHTGIVLRRLESGHIKTIEGNTKDPKGEIADRGVYIKIRSMQGTSDMKVLGYLNPFA